MTRRIDRSDDGSIIFTVLIILVVTALTFTLVAAAESGLRSSKRSGDAANALQVADAGINDAVKTITNYSGASPLVFTGSLAGGDEYEVTAVRESGYLWHVTSKGLDNGGVTRVVKADAVAQPVFSNAVFGNSGMQFGSGIAVDSFINGLSAANACSRRGYVGSNSPSTISLHVSGGGTGVRNCTQGLSPRPPGMPATGWVYDGCIGYAMNEPVPAFQNESSNDSCGDVRYETPSYPIDPVSVPSTPDHSGTTLNCSNMTLAPGTYVYTTVNIGNNCRAADSATMANPVKIFGRGAVTIGTGNGNEVNKPLAAGLDPHCATTVALVGNDYYSSSGSPLWHYCRGRAGGFQVLAAASGTTVNLGNHVTFWGTLYAPERAISGGPQAKVFGALAGASIASSAQITVHYDESLAGITNGRFLIDNWREVR